MSMTVDDYEWTQNLSHEVCGVIIKCGTKMRVQSQCMYATLPLKCRCNVSTSSLSPASRFSESSLKNWLHVIVSLQNVVILEC